MKIIGHRGFAGLKFENTIQGIRHAINEKIDFVEIDVQKTFNDKLIVFHDSFYDRLTNYQGNVKDLLDPQNLEITLKNGDSIPLLKDVILTVKDKIGLFVEVKDEETFEEIYLELQEHLSEDQFIIGSFFHEGLFQIKEKYPSLRTAIIIEAVIKDFSKYLDEIDCEFVVLSIDTFNEPTVKIIQSHNKKLIFYGLKYKPEFLLAYKAKAYGVITDFPSEARAYIKNLYNLDSSTY